MFQSALRRGVRAAPLAVRHGASPRCGAIASAARGYVASSKSTPMATAVDKDQGTNVLDFDEVDAAVRAAEPQTSDLLASVLANDKQERPANRPIYLDAQSTSPVDPRVLDKMMPFFINQYGNPHSRTHAYGWETESAVEEARRHIAELIGADSKEIIFTSGATETNNMALRGVAGFYKSKKNHVITTQTEHKCVLDSCRRLQEEGFEVTYLPVQENGRIDLEEFKAALRPTTGIVSIMTVNNEIGVIQPIKQIGDIIKTHGAELAKQLGKGTPKPFFHSDAAQALGKIPIDVNAAGIDLLSMSSHKLYGPKGIGAAFVRRRPRVRLEPIINGGGQERGLRSGTLATPLVVGFGEAARIAKNEMAVSTDEYPAWRCASKMIPSPPQIACYAVPAPWPGRRCMSSSPVHRLGPCTNTKAALLGRLAPGGRCVGAATAGNLRAAGRRCAGCSVDCLQQNADFGSMTTRMSLAWPSA